MSPKTIIILGRSGSGKGTQAKLLVDFLKAENERPVFYLESGQKFRDFIAQDSYSSRLSNQIMEAGLLQPAFLAVWNWAHLLIENLTGEEHLIIDGTPRAEVEAKVLDTALHFYHREPFAFIYLNISAEEGKKRLLLRGRGDDETPEKIDKRMAWFETSVLPAIEHYRSYEPCRFIEINGEQSVEQVQTDIKKALADYWV